MNNEQLIQWIKDLQSGMYLNCVYCGHRYGPGVGREALEEHVKQCPEHPLSKARELVQEAYYEGFEDGEHQALRYEWGGGHTDCHDCWGTSETKKELEEL